MAFTERGYGAPSMSGMVHNELPRYSRQSLAVVYRGISRETSSDKESRSDVSSGTSEALDENRFRPVPGGGESGDDPRHPSTGNRDICIVDTGNAFFRFRHKA